MAAPIHRNSALASAGPAQPVTIQPAVVPTSHNTAVRPSSPIGIGVSAPVAKRIFDAADETQGNVKNAALGSFQVGTPTLSLNPNVTPAAIGAGSSPAAVTTIAPVSLPTASTASAVIAGATPGDKLNLAIPKVSFTPFVVRVWDRSMGPADASAVNGGAKDLTIPVGKYIFTFRSSAVSNFPFVSTDRATPFSYNGKKMEMQKALLDPASGTLKVQVNVLENPDLTGGIADGVLGLLGFGDGGSSGGGLGILDSVDKILVDLSGALKWIVIVVGIGVAVYFLWPFLMRFIR